MPSVRTAEFSNEKLTIDIAVTLGNSLNLLPNANWVSRPSGWRTGLRRSFPGASFDAPKAKLIKVNCA